jgi:hypothetical protein
MHHLKRSDITNTHTLPNQLAEQLFAMGHLLPAWEIPAQNPSKNESARLFSAFLRGYGIDYRTLIAPFIDQLDEIDLVASYWKNQSMDDQFTVENESMIETSVRNFIQPNDAPAKLEDQIPGLLIEVQEGQKKQVIALAYDATGNGLKWPILGGTYVLRFQPQMIELPYRIRLRQARQILYPESPQTYSYESDILVLEKNKEPLPKTLSMNQVFETWDGYRFYLSSIGTSSDQNLKRILLIVNHDPAKYILTYPGALFVFIGTLLLFWVRPYAKK